MSTLLQLINKKIVAILRGIPSADTPAVAAALLKGGVSALEITLNSESALRSIETLSNQFEGSMLIGAGTVLSPDDAKDAIRAGAQFIISPNVDPETIKMTRELGAVSIPGAYTATEVVTAFKSGGEIIKIFPAGSAAYLKNLRGPLSHIPMMPTGGITIQNINEFAAAGAIAFGIGNNLAKGSVAVNEQYLSELTEKAIAFSTAIAK